MASKAELLRLAERVEALEGPDREVECRVWLAHTRSSVSFETAQSVEPNLWAWQAPAYLSSLDAAMTLVPEGWPFYVARDTDKCHANVCSGERPPKTSGGAFAATPALALTAASLRAIAQEDGR